MVPFTVIVPPLLGMVNCTLEDKKRGSPNEEVTFREVLQPERPTTRVRRSKRGSIRILPTVLYLLEFYFYLSIAYNQADRTDDALAICKKGLENIPEKSDKEFVSNFYAIMGDIYHTKKMNTEAYAAYDSALVYNSANLGALNNYAYYLSLERRDLDKAEEMSYKTVKSEPNN